MEDIYGHLTLHDALNKDFGDHCKNKNYGKWLREELKEFVTTFSDVPNNIEDFVKDIQPLVDLMSSECRALHASGELKFLYPSKPMDYYTEETAHTTQKSCLVHFITWTKDSLDVYKNNIQICREIWPKTQELINQFKFYINNKDKIPGWLEILKERLENICCHYTCGTCDGPNRDDCLTCVPVDTSNRYQKHSTCLPIAGHYDEEPNPIAPKCHYACKLCKDGTNKNCEECMPNRDLNQNCECNENLAEDDHDIQECIDCHYSCKTCTGPKFNQCKTCDLKYRVLEAFQCKPKEGTYEVPNQPETLDCNYSCQNCTGPDANQCTECWEDLQNTDKETHRQLTKEGRCECSLNDKFPLDIDQQVICQSCHCTCIDCTGPGIDECIQEKGCPHNTVFQDGCCEPKCGYFHPKTKEEIECPLEAAPCHYSCQTCSGPGADKCTSCAADLGRVEQDDGTCSCGIGSDDGTNQQCDYNCHYTCGQKCTGDKENECKEPCVKNREFKDGYCKPVDGTYDDKVTKPKPCHEACKTCDNGDIGDCITCNGDGRIISSDYKTIQGFFNGICICKEGWTEDKTKYTVNCTECEKGMVECQKVGEVIIPIICENNLVIQGNQCVCKDGTYQAGDTCLPCAKHCGTCEDFANKCTTCKGDKRSFYENTCPCDEKYFTNDEGECQRCHPVCKYCVGPKPDQCTVPISPFTKKPNVNLQMHYDFIIDNSSLTNINYLDKLPGAETKFDVIRIALSTFILNRNEDNWELGFFDKTTLIGADNDGTVYYKEEDINYDLIENIPEESHDGTPNLDAALAKYRQILDERPDDELSILTIIMGDSCDIKLVNLQYLKNSIRVHQVRVPQLQAERTCIYDKVEKELPEKTELPDDRDNINFDDPEKFVEYFGPIEITGYEPECLPNYYENEGYYKDPAETNEPFCRICDETCKECNLSAKVCTDCFEDQNRKLNKETNTCDCDDDKGFTEIQDTPVCQKKCLFDQFRDDKFECKKCNDNCNQSCSGPLKEDCQDCPSGLFLTIADSKGNSICKECHKTCLTCSNEDIDDCVTCSTAKNRVFLSNKCICKEGWMEDTSGDCIKICDISEYRVDPETCKTCHYTCETCMQGDNTSCLTCGKNDKRELENNQCKCNEGFVDVGNDTGVCQPCDKTCQTCTLTSETCVICANNRYKLDNSCFCNNGFYQSDDEEKSCQQCKQECLTCENATTCSSCNKNGNGTVLIDGNCKCPGEGYYEQASKCQECYVTCKTCNGPNKDNCLSCYEEEQNRELENTTCVPKPGHYEPNKPTAEKCHPACKECDGGNDNECTDCRDKQHLDPKPKGKCVADPHHFIDITYISNPCHYTCKECVNGDNNGCTECWEGRLNPPERGMCLCEFQSYDNPNEDEQPFCSACHITCHTCFGPELNNCHTCDTETNFRQFSKANKTCSCTEGYYDQNEKEVCEECHFSCQTCLKAGKDPQNECESCNFYREFIKERKFCEPKPNTYECGEKIPCKCHYTCLTCFGPDRNNCVTCDEINHNREFKSEENTCPPKPGYYEVPEEPFAPKCSIQCKECTDNRNEGFECCTKPADHYVFVNKQKKCLVKPENGWYHCKVCKPPGPKECEPICKKCKDTAEFCTDCCDHYDLLPKLGQCKIKTGYYEIEPCTAIKCIPNCLQCNNTTTCIVCDSNKDFYEKDGKCMCKSTHYVIFNTSVKHDICMRCHYSCLTCSGAKVCLTCNDIDHMRELKDDQCVCSEGFYDIDTKPVCGECHVSAKKCTGPNNDDCKEPADGYIKKGTICTPICGDYCTSCTINMCKTCKLNSKRNQEPDDIRDCKINPGYYDDGKKNIKKCDFPCFECTAAGMSCINCVNNYQLIEGTTICKQDNVCSQFDMGIYATSTGAEIQKHNQPCPDQTHDIKDKQKLTFDFISEKPKGTTTNILSFQGEGAHCSNVAIEINVTDKNVIQVIIGTNIYEVLKLVKGKKYHVDIRWNVSKKYIAVRINQTIYLQLENFVGPVAKNATKFFASDDCKNNTDGFLSNVKLEDFDGPEKPLPVIDCHYTCLTCFGPTQINCITCEPTHNREFIESNNSCPPKPGYYEEPGKPKAPKCSVQCDECSDNRDDGFACCKVPAKNYRFVSEDSCTVEPFPGYYHTDDGAKKCSPHCYTCINEGNIYCTRCNNNFTLNKIGGQIHGQCKVDPGFWEDPKDPGVAIPCHPTCLTCSKGGDDYCTKCDTSNNYATVSNGRCNCIPYHFMQNYNCYPCHFSCGTCDGHAINDCLTCELDKHERKLTDDGKCIPIDGNWETNEPVTKPCDISAKRCNGPLKTDCLEENPGYVYYNGVCLPKCGKFCLSCTVDECKACVLNAIPDPDNIKQCIPKPTYYEDPKDGIIKPCDRPCYECTDAGQNCENCINNYMIEDEKICVYVPSGGSIIFEDGHSVNFIPEDEEEKECKECHYTCETCKGEANNDPALCLTCNILREFVQGSCPPIDGYYEKEPEVFPPPCNYTCQTCTGPTKLECITCNDTRLKTVNGTEISCPPKPGHYEEPNKPRAPECSVQCKTCTDNTKGGFACCKEPAENYIWDEEKGGQEQCTVKPAPGYYHTEEGAKPCNCHCKECFDSAEDNCLDCYLNFYLEAAICVVQPEYYEESCQVAKPCHYTCKTCTGAEKNNCESCDNDHNRIFEEDENTCPPKPGNYEKPNEPIAPLCSIQCEQCTDNKKEGFECCTIPAKSYVFVDPEVKCLVEPGPGIWHCNGDGCEPEGPHECDKSCRQCKNEANDQCTKCYLPNELKIIANGVGVCEPPCHYTCLTCFGPDRNNCETCDEENHNREFKSDENTCPPKLGHYEVPEEPFAPKCSIQCKECTDNRKDGFECCTIPADNYIFVPNTECEVKPAPGIFHCVKDDDTCEEGPNPCHDSCEECSYGTEFDCTDCFGGYYLHDGSCNVNPPISECNDPCKECETDEPDTCTDCYKTKNQVLDSDSKTCVCKAQYFDNKGQCEKCHSTCATCDGAEFNNCKTCFEGISKLNEAEKTCHIICDKSCKTCFGPAENQCILCPDDSEATKEEPKNICNINCYPVCLECDGLGINDCTKCDEANNFVPTQNGSCACKITFYLQDLQCVKCDSPCNECTAAGMNCSNCIDSDHFQFNKEDNSCTEIPKGGSIDIEGNHSVSIEGHHSVNIESHHSANFEGHHSVNIEGHHSVNIEGHHSAAFEGHHSLQVEGHHSLQFGDSPPCDCYYWCLTCKPDKAIKKPDSCITCPEPSRYFDKGQCLPAKEYYENGKQIAGPCDKSAKRCTGPLNTDCLEPKEGYQIKDTTCTPICGHLCEECTIDLCILCFDEDSSLDPENKKNCKHKGSSVDLEGGHSVNVEGGHSVNIEGGHSINMEGNHSVNVEHGHSVNVEKGGHSASFEKAHSVAMEHYHSVEINFGSTDAIPCKCYYTCVTCHQDKKGPDSCITCPEPVREFDNGECKAADGYFENGKHIPGPCDKSAKRCTGPLNTDCLEPNEGYYKDSDNHICLPKCGTLCEKCTSEMCTLCFKDASVDPNDKNNCKFKGGSVDLEGGHSVNMEGEHSIDMEHGHSVDMEGGHSVDMEHGHSIDLENGHSIDMEHGHSVDLEHGHSIDLENGHSIDMEHGHSIDLEHGHSIDLENGHSIDLEHGHSIDLEHGHSVDLEHGHSIDLEHGHSIDLEHGHSIDLEHGHSIDLEHGHSIDLEHGHSIDLEHGHSIGLEHGHSIDLEHGHSINLEHGHSINLEHGHSINLEHGHSINLEHGHSINLEHGHSIALEFGDTPNPHQQHCLDCHPTCKTCKKTSEKKDNECITCVEPLRKLNKGYCNTTDGYYENGKPIPGECDKSAKRCTGPLNSDCLEPNEGFSIKDTTCTSVCGLLCAQCNSNLCTQCFKDSFLDPENKKNCKFKGSSIVLEFNGQENSNQKHCFDCHPTCLTCKETEQKKDNECLTCQTPVRKLVGGYCKPTDGHYENGQPIAGECHQSAKRCTGPLNTDCLEPNEGYYINNNVCKPHCGLNCNACTGTLCSICKDDFVLDSNNKQNCVTHKSSIVLEFENEKNPNQIHCKCHYSCLTCEGDSELPNKCKLCPTPLRTFQSGYCKPVDGYYENGQNIPGKCDPSAKTCDGPSNTDCETPNAGYYMKHNTCLPKCGANCKTCTDKQCTVCANESYIINTNDMLSCTSPNPPIDQSCHFSCSTCGSKLANKCITCPPLRIEKIVPGDGKYCIPIPGYYESGNKIPGKCHKSSKTCSGPDNNNCLKPNEGYNKSGQICNYVCSKFCAYCTDHNCKVCMRNTQLDPNNIKNCVVKDHYYEDPSTAEVKECDVSCDRCKDTATNCTKGSVLLEGNHSLQLEKYHSLNLEKGGHSLDLQKQGEGIRFDSVDFEKKDESLFFEREHSLDIEKGGHSLDLQQDGKGLTFKSLDLESEYNESLFVERNASIDIDKGGHSVDIDNGSLDIDKDGHSVDIDNGGHSVDVDKGGHSVDIDNGGHSVDIDNGSLDIDKDGHSVDIDNGGHSVDVDKGGHSVDIDNGENQVNIDNGSLDIDKDGHSVDIDNGGHSVDVDKDGRSVDIEDGHSLNVQKEGSLDIEDGKKSINVERNQSAKLNVGGHSLDVQQNGNSVDLEVDGHSLNVEKDGSVDVERDAESKNSVNLESGNSVQIEDSQSLKQEKSHSVNADKTHSLDLENDGHSFDKKRKTMRKGNQSE